MNTKIKEKTKYIVKTSTTELPLIWQKGFIAKWRSASEIVEEFAKTGCHFSASAVSKALSRAPFITSKGEGKRLRYIQAYPFNN